MCYCGLTSDDCTFIADGCSDPNAVELHYNNYDSEGTFVLDPAGGGADNPENAWLNSGNNLLLSKFLA